MIPLEERIFGVVAIALLMPLHMHFKRVQKRALSLDS